MKVLLAGLLTHWAFTEMNTVKARIRVVNFFIFKWVLIVWSLKFGVTSNSKLQTVYLIFGSSRPRCFFLSTALR